MHLGKSESTCVAKKKTLENFLAPWQVMSIGPWEMWRLGGPSPIVISPTLGWQASLETSVSACVA